MENCEENLEGECGWKDDEKTEDQGQYGDDQKEVSLYLVSVEKRVGMEQREGRGQTVRRGLA